MAAKSYNSFAKASVGTKAAKGAAIGATAGGVKGATGYKAENDNGTFGQSRIGQVAKGALGGAAAGGAAGAAVGLATKGLKPINRTSAPPNVPAKPLGLQPPKVQGPAGKAPTATAAKPATGKAPNIDPVTGHITLDPSQYKVSQYIDELFIEKMAKG
jgi:hypothetical protein